MNDTGRLKIRKYIPYATILIVIVACCIYVCFYCCWNCSPTTVILVRHAEKDMSQPSNPLSPAGEARAQKLVHVAGSSGITTIYTSNALRAKQTAQPLANSMGITPVEIDPMEIQDFVDGIMSHKGETILVVGHSNTVPLIIQEIGVVNPPPISEETYDNLFIVSFCRCCVRLTHLKYGDPS